jgi:hypothetical protein
MFCMPCLDGPDFRTCLFFRDHRLQNRIEPYRSCFLLISCVAVLILLFKLPGHSDEWHRHRPGQVDEPTMMGIFVGNGQNTNISLDDGSLTGQFDFHFADLA